MALNWDTFLDTEQFNISNDQWSDLPPPPSSAPLTSDMPKSISSQTSGSTPEDVTNFESLLNNNASGDPYFDDSLFLSNDYFLGDLDVLQPFGNTVGGDMSATESSPEPNTGTSDFSPYRMSPSTSNQPTQMSSSQRQSIQRAKAFPNPAFESLFPNGLEAGFVEDVSFSNRPDGSSGSTMPSQDRHKTAADTAAKRNKSKPDILSACWTSPLCPNHDQDGPPPNPSSCGGGCAPFLFANDDALPSINNLLAESQDVMVEDGVVEIQRRSKKRSESASSMNEPSGRQFTNQNTNDTSTEARERLKSETSEDSPHVLEEQKPKSRRRLPHNQVERKYRESLNTQLESLRRVVPSLQQSQRVCDGADIEDLPAPSKPSKAVILASATAHIKQLEKERKQVADENLLLRTRIKALQALVKCEDCNLMQYVMNLKINQAK